jgi:hypothetical protein
MSDPSGGGEFLYVLPRDEHALVGGFVSQRMERRQAGRQTHTHVLEVLAATEGRVSQVAWSVELSFYSTLRALSVLVYPPPRASVLVCSSLLAPLLVEQAAFDVNYSPASNPKHWFGKKQAALARFMKDPAATEFYEKYMVLKRRFVLQLVLCYGAQIAFRPAFPFRKLFLCLAG